MKEKTPYECIECFYKGLYAGVLTFSSRCEKCGSIYIVPLQTQDYKPASAYNGPERRVPVQLRKAKRHLKLVKQD